MTYSYAWKLIDAIQKNDIKMTEEMIEDMTTEQFETENWVQKFLNNLKKRESAFRENEHKTGVKGNFYYPVRNAIWDTFGPSICTSALFCTFSECFAIGFTSFLIVLIAFIKDPESKTLTGIGYLCIFSAMMACSSIFRNYYIFHGYVTSINMRKTLISALYIKMSKLSMKSLTETNSGKLVTIVSGDI